MRSAALALSLVALVVAAGAGAHPLSRAPGCPIFPADSHWNQRVDGLPVAAGSAEIVRSIGLDQTVHADFGSGTYEGRPIGIPYTTVPARQRRVRVSFEYAGESNRGPYPIPRNAPSDFESATMTRGAAACSAARVAITRGVTIP